MDHGEIAASIVGTTKDIIADILTKPQQGGKSKEPRAKLVGECDSECSATETAWCCTIHAFVILKG